MLPRVWFNVSQTQAQGQYSLTVGIDQSAEISIYGTLDELRGYADEITQAVEAETRYAECAACQAGQSAPGGHTCPLGDLGDLGDDAHSERARQFRRAADVLEALSDIGDLLGGHRCVIRQDRPADVHPNVQEALDVIRVALERAMRGEAAG